MCNTKRDTLAAEPSQKSRPRTPKPFSSSYSGGTTAGTSFPTSASGGGDDTNNTAATRITASSSSTSSSHVSLSNLREALPEGPNFYRFNEICAATNNFLAKRLSSSASSWRCILRGKDAVVFQRRFRGDPARLHGRITAACKINHNSIARLLGAALGGDYVYLVYEYINGASLAECLRNPRNPSFTPLKTWLQRMQVAADLAKGLEYIHLYTAEGGGGETPSQPTSGSNRRGSRRGSRRRPPVHNRIKSSSVMITEDLLHAKICHFGAMELVGDDPADEEEDPREISEISEDFSTVSSSKAAVLRRSDSREMKIEGTRGYIAPEILAGGRKSQKSDVFSFGVVLLELMTGEEPLKYRYDPSTKHYESVSLIETAREVMGSEEEEEEEGAEAVERRQRIRRWVDRRLKDSFPVEVAVRMARVALECVRAEAERRPDMERVAGKVSRLLMESQAWADRIQVPTDFSVSMAPR